MARLLGDEGERDQPQVALRQHAPRPHHVVRAHAVAVAAAASHAAVAAAAMPADSP
jgi:hypothetical protein